MERIGKSYDIRFDIDAKEEPYFLTANAVHRKVRTNRYVPVRDLLALIQTRRPTSRSSMKLAKVYTRLDRVRKIRDREIVAISVDHDLEAVVDIFAGLNSKGTRVKEADIYLGIVAARSAGWVREQFMPFLDKLEQQGVGITPNWLFQSSDGGWQRKSASFKLLTTSGTKKISHQPGRRPSRAGIMS